MENEKYGIGIASFEKIRQKVGVYVDKTKYIYDLVNCGPDSFFLCRPRRFGKRLFLSTLEAFFSGKKELFEGLDIYEREKDWQSYPVLHFDFTSIEAHSAIKLETYLRLSLERIALKYDLTLKSVTGIGRTFASLIKGIANKTGKDIVILIDEYDKPFTEVFDKKKQLEMNQTVLTSFLSATKSQNQYIRFCFITGVTSFPHFSIVSEVNHLYDISLDPNYASICGISMDELIRYFPQGLQKLSKNWHLSHNEVIDKLKNEYGGYRFSCNDSQIFNPSDLIYCLEKGILENYWYHTGISWPFIKLLSKQRNIDLETLTKHWVSKGIMLGNLNEEDLVPLLYQYGYLTIKDYDSELYKLGIPNQEVREVLYALLHQYLGKQIS